MSRAAGSITARQRNLGSSTARSVPAGDPLLKGCKKKKRILIGSTGGCDETGRTDEENRYVC